MGGYPDDARPPWLEPAEMFRIDDDCCAGSRQPPRELTLEDDDWVGECATCGRAFALGYAGLIPLHEPVDDTDE